MKWTIAAVTLLAVGALSVGWYAGLQPLESDEDRESSPPSQPPAPADEPIVELAREKQEAIWLSEHITFELETHFGGSFKAALRERNREALRDLFLDDFQGRTLPANTQPLLQEAAIVTRKAWTGDGEPLVPVDAAGITADLMQRTAPIATIEQLKLRVLRIEADPDAPDAAARQVWKTHLLLACTGTTADGTPIASTSHHDAVFKFRDPAELKDSATVAHWETVSAEQRRSEQELMHEVTAEVGLDTVDLQDNWTNPFLANTYNFQMAVADYDRDGRLDVALAGGDMRPRLLHCEADGSFADVTESTALRAWLSPSTLAGWIDYDNDGYPDLLAGNRLYHNQGGQEFTEVTHLSGLRLGFDPMGCTVVDYDCDGWLDLYVLYQNRKVAEEGKVPWVGDNQSGVKNQLWRNRGDGTFEDVTERSGAHGGTRLTFAATWLFFDDDHYPDLYIANDFGRNVLLRNQGDGTFEDITESTRSGDFATSMGVASGDLDNDGSPEIYVANMYSKMGRRIIGAVGGADYPEGIFRQIQGSCKGNTLYRWDPESSSYQELGAQAGINAVGWAFAPALADWDNDGLLDVYAATGYHSFERDKPDG